MVENCLNHLDFWNCIVAWRHCRVCWLCSFTTVFPVPLPLIKWTLYSSIPLLSYFWSFSSYFPYDIVNKTLVENQVVKKGISFSRSLVAGHVAFCGGLSICLCPACMSVSPSALSLTAPLRKGRSACLSVCSSFFTGLFKTATFVFFGTPLFKSGHN